MSPTTFYTLSLHDALPISARIAAPIRDRTSRAHRRAVRSRTTAARRSEEHTSELQSRRDLVCRLLLEKKNVDARRAAQGNKLMRLDLTFHAPLGDRLTASF